MRQVYFAKKQMREKNFKKMTETLNDKSNPNLFYIRNSKVTTKLLKKPSVTKFGQSLLKNSISGSQTIIQTHQGNEEDYCQITLTKQQSTINNFDKEGRNSPYNTNPNINM